ncbi:MAG: hypothetical protein Rpha_1932 [Candidatus Ruthia sp. Apha_13_S6]|nr:hypothetical protein [Candidatus Ruthia sp. Apha_13_S6]
MAVSPVTEISFEKYADMTGIPHKRVKDWCLQGVLTCRRLDDNGKEISDWSKTPKLGHWYIDIAKCIGEC